ncbi:MAG: histidine phosphatase family protein [Cyanobacteria bacterium P01_A01_bin.105]
MATHPSLKSPYLTLILIRHAESWGNRWGRMEGHTSTALTRRGCQQARRLRAYLRQQSPPQVCYTSPTLRTAQTAAMLCAPDAQGQIVSLQTDPALQEIHPGIFQGLTWAEATVHYPHLCQQLCNQLTLVPIPQAESPHDARQRADHWLTHCLRQHQPGETVWGVSHSGILQHLVGAVLGCDRTWQIQIPHTALFEFWLSQPSDLTVDGLNPERWKIKQFNDCPHLDSSL